MSGLVGLVVAVVVATVVRHYVYRLLRRWGS